MKQSFFVLISCLILLLSCKSRKGPDVSGISVQLTTERFEKDFFALDTNDLNHSLEALSRKYPGFLGDFSHILGLPPERDSSGKATMLIKQFLHDYRPVYDSVARAFPSLEKEEKEIEEGLKHVKYYFPSYKLPAKLVTFIGPMDAFFEASTASYGDAIVTDGLATGLQLHLGAEFSMYHSEMGLALYPAYISRKFTPEYIPVNCIKNIVDDLFPDQNGDRTLIEQMVEKGKRIYLVDQLMPATPDTLKIGYTGKQLAGCRENEGLIWNYFLKNSLVYNSDPSLIKNYIGDSPNTPEFGEGAPGYIGLFTGWQIVKKYMDKHSALSLTELMNTDPKKLFEESGYRPK
jgi:hypothetical protein